MTLDSQATVSAEIAALAAEAEAAGFDTVPQPKLDYAPYRSSVLRSPTRDPKHTDPETIELWAPAFGHRDVDPLEADLTIGHPGEPIGERITITGKVTDGES